MRESVWIIEELGWYKNLKMQYNTFCEIGSYSDTRYIIGSRYVSTTFRNFSEVIFRVFWNGKFKSTRILFVNNKLKCFLVLKLYIAKHLKSSSDSIYK